jgi:hypothetical protein
VAFLSLQSVEDVEMPAADDTVGEAIWPTKIPGDYFFTTERLAREVGIGIHQAESIIEVLVQEGLLQPWFAPQCPNCDEVWAAYLGEDDIPVSIHCPFCGEGTPEHLMEFYLVYERLKTLPD